MKFDNYMILDFPSKSANEAFARSAVACFAAQMDPTLEELGDIRTAVSEAVTNCIVHAYKNRPGDIYIAVRVYDTRKIKIEIKDKGCGIEDVELAKTPLYTTDGSGERSGMGFAVMESFMDKLVLRSVVGKYTKVTLTKVLSPVEI